MATSFSCEKCSRNFATQQGLITHLAKLHEAREHQPYKKNSPDQTKD